MLVALLIVSFITCLSAQTCDVANQTLQMDSECLTALRAVVVDGANSSTNETAVMMVCGEGTNTTCSQNIRTYLSNCPFSELNIIEVWCANSSTHSNRYCVDILPDLDSLSTIIFDQISEVCVNDFLIGDCSSECREALQGLRISYGCCLPELLTYLNRIGELSNPFYGLYLVSLPTLLCGIQNSFCDGRALPGDPDNCSAAYTSLYGQQDFCSRVIRRTIQGDISAFADYNAVSNDCRTRFQNFFTSCNEIFNDEASTELMQFIDGGFALAVATNNGQSCSRAVSSILIRENQLDVCIKNYFNRRCSFTCRDVLVRLVESEQFGCCFNSFVAILTGNSRGLNDPIKYIILTREIYDLCDLQNPGFCTGINIPYSAVGEECVTAANQFFAQDDLCTNSYRLLGELTSLTSVQSATTGICTNDMCKSRLDNYANYLFICRVGNFAKDDDNNDDDGGDPTAYITFANLTRDITCTMRSDGTSCYALINLDDITNIINNAFDFTNQSAPCISTFIGTCTNECKQFFTQVLNNTGCCIGEYGYTVLGASTVTGIASLCANAEVGQRCPVITSQQADRCTRAQNALLDSANTCGNAFFAFQNAYFDDDDDDIITTLQENLNEICRRDSCKAAVSEYLDACKDIGINFGNNYEELLMEFNGYACRESNGNTEGDCFVLDNSDPTINALGEAFISGVCRSVINGSCSSDCRDTLQRAVDSAGCCAYLIGDVFLQELEEYIGVTTTVDEVGRACNLPVSRDCAMQTTIDGRGAAMEKRGLNIVILVIIAMLL